MRNLTIKREKSFVGCFAKSRIYVCDELVGDTKINGDKCYKLGELKNGEEQNFVIGDGETKIYVVADKLSRNICNEVCYIPAGVENIYLMGECKYNPIGGNCFRFHGMTDPRVLANRKKSTKKYGVFFAICIIVGIIAGFFSGYEAPTYAKDGEPYEIVDDSGVIITLTDTFVDSELEGFTFSYSTSDVGVIGVQEAFTIFEGFEDYTIEEYAEMMIRNNKREDAEYTRENGVDFIEYVFYNEQEGINYAYLVAMYKTEDSFWAINFAVAEEEYETYRPLFLEWAKSVEFVEE